MRPVTNSRQHQTADEKSKTSHGSANPVGHVHHLVDRGDDPGVHLVAPLRLDQIGYLGHDVDGRLLEISLAQRTAAFEAGIATARLP